MKAIPVALALAVPLILTACPRAADEPPDAAVHLETTLQPQAGWEHLSGAATAEGLPGARVFSASVALTGDEPGQVRPWHVHHGSCQQGGEIVGMAGGEIVGMAGQYPPLVVAADSTGSAAADVETSLERGADYHVNVHRSTAELATIIACGDLVRAERP